MDYRPLVLVFSVILASGCMGSSSESGKNVDFQELEDRSIEIKENIMEVSSNGGATTARLNFTDLSAEVNESGNYLDLTVPSETGVYPGKFTLVDGESRSGIGDTIGFGYESEDQPGVVLAKSRGGKTVYRIEFRKIRVYQRPYEMYKIQLEGPESTVERPQTLDMTMISTLREDVETTFENRSAQVRTVDLKFSR